MAAPLKCTGAPRVYARGSRWVAVHLEDGRRRRRSAATFREAREIKVRATAQEAGRRAGPTLHGYALEWIDHYAGRGANDVINDRTRREYRRLPITYALVYFAPEERLGDIDEQRSPRVRGLAVSPGRRRRPPALRPLGARRRAAAAVLPTPRCPGRASRRRLRTGDPPAAAAAWPRLRARRATLSDARATHAALGRDPRRLAPFFNLLASTGLRISEAVALRIMDADLDAERPRIHVRRAIVDGQWTGPQSRHGRRTIPISHELADRLAVRTVDREETELLFVGARGATLRPGNLRYRVMIPRPSARAFPGRAFTRCVTPARRC
jgi:integrase